ncbi:MAG: hypothetical protein WCG47_01560 [Dermatophilaceae bacterium]
MRVCHTASAGFAEVAEISFTAFTSRRLDEHISARLIVRASNA